MYQDQLIRSHVHNGLTIEGYSRAAMQTYWRIAEMKLGFDIGAQPWSFMGTPRWFISHSHMDHILALPAYVARRRMMKMEPPTIYMPLEVVDNVKRLLSVFSQLDHGRLPCDIIGLSPGDEVALSRELVVTAHKTKHPVSSLGYIVWERRKKLKEQYKQLTGEQIRDLALAGTEITNEHRLPRVAYLGDSSADGLDNTPAMYDADILIFEMTFVAKRHSLEKIHKFGHIHLQDIMRRRACFKNGCIIASHFSTRCTDKEIEATVKKHLPDMLDGRMILWF
jgi:ribonuclease Z